MPESDSINIRKASVDDLPLLFTVCRQSYSENFAHHWNEGGLAWYLDQAYAPEGIKADLMNQEIHYFIAFFHNEPAGFMKLRLNSSGSDHVFESGMEIEKLYFRPPYQGKGIGKQMMSIALDVGRELEKRIIWLGVIDTNVNAIEFYRKIGFELVDKTTLDIPYFKDELKGMWRMRLRLA